MRTSAWHPLTLALLAFSVFECAFCRELSSWAGEHRAEFTLPSMCLRWASTRDGSVVVCATIGRELVWHSESGGRTQRIEIASDRIGELTPVPLIGPDDQTFAIVTGPRKSPEVLRIRASDGEVLVTSSRGAENRVEFNQLRGFVPAADGLGVASAVGTGRIVFWAPHDMHEVQTKMAPEDLKRPFAVEGAVAIAVDFHDRLGCFRLDDDRWIWQMERGEPGDARDRWTVKECSIFKEAGLVVVVESQIDLPAKRVRYRARSMQLATGEVSRVLDSPSLIGRIQTIVSKGWLVTTEVNGVGVYSANTFVRLGRIDVELTNVMQWGVTGDGNALWAFYASGRAVKRDVEFQPVEEPNAAASSNSPPTITRTDR